MNATLISLLGLLAGSVAGSSAVAQTQAMCAGFADATAWTDSHEAVTAAPKNHKVIYETANLRVLEVTVMPGERELAHHHRWPSVMAIDSRPTYINYDKDGREFKSAVQAQQTVELPLVVRLPAQAEHAIQNTGDKPFHAIRIEYKNLCTP